MNICSHFVTESGSPDYMTCMLTTTLWRRSLSFRTHFHGWGSSPIRSIAIFVAISKIAIPVAISQNRLLRPGSKTWLNSGIYIYINNDSSIKITKKTFPASLINLKKRQLKQIPIGQAILDWRALSACKYSPFPGGFNLLKEGLKYC